MCDFFEITERGDYATALDLMKKNEAKFLQSIKNAVIDDDHDALDGLKYAYDIAMDRVTGTFDPGPGHPAAAGPVDSTLAIEFATVLQNFIIQAGDEIGHDLRGIRMFTDYEERKRERQAGMYYRQYSEFLKQQNYATANDFISRPDYRDKVVSYLILKLSDATEVGFQINLQELFESISDRETAAIFNELYEAAKKSVKQQEELEKAMGAVNMTGGRKSRRRAKISRRRAKKSRRRAKISRRRAKISRRSVRKNKSRAK